MSDKPAIQVLADFASDLREEDVPDYVRRQAILCILDTLGCQIAGSVQPETKAVIESEIACLGNENLKNGCTVVGSEVRLPPPSAARVNAFAGDIFELNDLLGGHASIGNISAALCQAENIQSKGSDLVAAIVAGLEVTSKIFYSYYYQMKSYEEQCLVPVGIPSSIGAAAISSKLLKLTAQQIREALSIGAATAEINPAEVIFGNGGSMKPILFGSLPAETGIKASFLAKSGLTGPPEIFDSAIGIWNTVANGRNYQAITNAQWYLSSVTRKHHAACGHTHSALDTVIGLRNKHAKEEKTGKKRWPPRKIRVEMPIHVVSTVSKSNPPTTSNEARFHLEYLLAIAAIDDEIISVLPYHSMNFQEYLADPRVRALMQNISVEGTYPRDTFYHTSRVTLEFSSGEQDKKENTTPKGSPKNPLSEEEVIKKFHTLSEPVIGDIRTKTICKLVLDIEKLPSVTPIFEQLKH